MRKYSTEALELTPQEETTLIAVGLAIFPILNLLAAIRFIHITVRVTADWFSDLYV